MDKNMKHFLTHFKNSEGLQDITVNRLRNYELHSRTENNNEGNIVSKEQYNLKNRNIFDTFHFLLSHLVVHQPENPIQYLHRLLDDCILFRSGLKQPRLIWSERHVDAVFRSSNCFNCSDLLLLDNYKIGMKILGASSYNPCPVQRIPGYVDRQTFCMEALGSLERELLANVEVSATSDDEPSVF